MLLQFGEVDIDGSLVAAKTTGAEDIVMLNNGCLCCTVRGDLVRMISELVEKKKGKFDHIVIETTGRKFMFFLSEVIYLDCNKMLLFWKASKFKSHIIEISLLFLYPLLDCIHA